MNVRHLLIVLGIVVAGSVAVYTLRPADAAAVDFTDGLTGPTSEYFDIPFDKYTLTPEGLLRVHSASGRSNGTDRPMVRTRSDQYLARDFVFEVDITIPKDSVDLVFVGLGDGETAPPYNEPSGSFGFRIHHLPDNHEVRLSASGAAGTTHVVQETIGMFPEDGTLTVRLERFGDLLIASLPRQDGSERTVRISAHPSVLTRGHGFLYLSNTAEGTLFSNVRVRAR